MGGDGVTTAGSGATPARTAAVPTAPAPPAPDPGPLTPPTPAPRGATAWAFYDFANTIFSMNVTTMYLAQWVVVDRGVEDLWYSVAYSLSMLLVALTLPVLGAMSDATGGRVRYLFGFTVAAVTGTALIGLAALNVPGLPGVLAALGAFLVANYAFQGSLVFYNALLPVVSTPATIGRVSGFGVSLGYAGAIAGLLMVAPFVDGKLPMIPLHFSWPHAGGRAAAFYPTALFFALFAVPLFLRVRDPRRVALSRSGGVAGAPLPPLGTRVRTALSEVVQTLRDTARYPGVRRFLIANYLFVDAISTVILFMAVYAHEVMDMPDAVKIPFFIVATTGAVIGSLIFGHLSDRLGPRRVLSGILLGWVAALAAIALTSAPIVFWLTGGVVGALMGGTWTTSRPLLAGLTPAAEHGRFFGLYALSDKAAAVVGPLLWGLIIWAGKPLGPLRYRLAVASLALFVAAGWWLLRGVPEGGTPGGKVAAAG